MTEEQELQKLRERHSELCAKAHVLKIDVPEDLIFDFDTTEAGRTICASLEKLVAAAPEVEHAAKPAKTPKTPAKAKSKKPVAEASAQQESDTMAKTAKKTAAKKPAKKSVKKVAKKSAKAGAKKAPAKKAGASKPRGDTKVSKVIAKMKNGGITRAEVLKMTGWKAVSMQQLAESAGVNLKISAERPFTYKC